MRSANAVQLLAALVVTLPLALLDGVDALFDDWLDGAGALIWQASPGTGVRAGIGPRERHWRIEGDAIAIGAAATAARKAATFKGANRIIERAPVRGGIASMTGRSQHRLTET